MLEIALVGPVEVRNEYTLEVNSTPWDALEVIRLAGCTGRLDTAIIDQS